MPSSAISSSGERSSATPTRTSGPTPSSRKRFASWLARASSSAVAERPGLEARRDRVRARAATTDANSAGIVVSRGYADLRPSSQREDLRPLALRSGEEGRRSVARAARPPPRRGARSNGAGARSSAGSKRSVAYSARVSSPAAPATTDSVRSNFAQPLWTSIGSTSRPGSRRERPGHVPIVEHHLDERRAPGAALGAQRRDELLERDRVCARARDFRADAREQLQEDRIVARCPSAAPVCRRRSRSSGSSSSRVRRVTGVPSSEIVPPRPAVQQRLPERHEQHEEGRALALRERAQRLRGGGAQARHLGRAPAARSIGARPIRRQGGRVRRVGELLAPVGERSVSAAPARAARAPSARSPRTGSAAAEAAATRRRRAPRRAQRARGRAGRTTRCRRRGGAGTGAARGRRRRPGSSVARKSGARPRGSKRRCRELAQHGALRLERFRPEIDPLELERWSSADALARRAVAARRWRRAARCGGPGWPGATARAGRLAGRRAGAAPPPRCTAKRRSPGRSSSQRRSWPRESGASLSRGRGESLRDPRPRRRAPPRAPPPAPPGAPPSGARRNRRGRARCRGGDAGARLTWSASSE